MPPKLKALFDAGAEELKVTKKMLLDGVPPEGGNVDRAHLEVLIEAAFQGGLLEGYQIRAKEEACQKN